MPDTSLEEKFTRGDRDTIIRLDEKVNSILDGMKDLKENLIDRVTNLEKDKADNKCIPDIVARVESLEGSRKYVLGAFSLATVIVALITYIYFKDINDIKTELTKHVESTQITK